MICDPEKRYSAEEVLKHTWVAQIAPHSEECLLTLDIDTMKDYIHSNKFKKAALTFIATRMKDDEIKTLREVFSAIDINNDGTLTLQEIKQGCEKLKSVINIDIDFEELFLSFDTNKSGTINYTEFIAGTIDHRCYLKNERLFEAFRNFDKDGSGKISKSEVGQILVDAQIEDINSIEEAIKKFDLDGDGEMDYNEFCNMMASY
jgi:calcium-dependent protein kinase